MNEFLEEAKTKFEKLEDMMGELRRGVAEGRDVEPVLGRMIREVHTIKGLASLAGFSTLNKAAHWLETLLELAAEGELKPERDFMDVVGDFMSAIGNILKSNGQKSRRETQRYLQHLLLCTPGACQRTGRSPLRSRK
jgi:two-component system chemotaxis sensor kinase CheA